MSLRRQARPETPSLPAVIADGGGPPAGNGDLRYAWRVLSVTGLGMTVTFFNTSMLPVALPDMVSDLGADSLQGDWMLLAYQLVTAVLMLPLGRVSDVLGRRTMYIAGLALLALSSGLIVVAGNPELVIGLRALQGIGAAAVIVNTTALLVDAFPPAMVSVGIGWNITIMSCAIALGPLTGGWLTETFGWRAVFAVSAPLALIGTVWSAITLRRMPPGRPETFRFDFAGTVTSVVAIGSLVLLVSVVGQSGWGSPLVTVLAATTVLGLAAFVLIERRAAQPLLDFQLVGQRFRGSAYGATALLSLGQTSIALLISLYLQSAGGMSAFHAGLQLTAMAVGNVLAAPIAGRLAIRIETRVLATIGASVVTLGMLVLAAVCAAGGQGAALIAVLLLIGIGNGFFATTNAAAINVGVLPHQRGMANGFRVMIDNSAALIGSAMALVLVTVWLPSELRVQAISGELAILHPDQQSNFLDGFPFTLLVLATLGMLAVLVSVFRGKAPVDGVLVQPVPADAAAVRG